MPGFAAGLWDVATAAGGGAALAFIVAIALGINALTVLFFGSAVVVLERFARAARRWSSVAVAAVAVSVLAAGLLRGLHDPAATDETRAALASWPGAFGASLAICLLCIGLAWVLLRFLPSATLGRVALLALGLGYAVLVGGLGSVGWAIAPPLVALLAWGALVWRRRGRAAGPTGEAALPGEAEGLLRILGLALLVGVPLALALPEAQPPVASSGAAVLLAMGLLVFFGLLPLAAAGLLDVRGTVEWFIAVRYLVAKRRQTFISVITLICVGGVAVGVWLIITVLSVMNGFERTWRDEIIGNRAHFTVHSGLGAFGDYRAKLDAVREVPGVVGAAPYLDAEGMVRGGAGEIVGVRVRGIDPALVGQVTDLPEDVVAGDLDDLEVRDPADEGVEGAPGIVIGSELSSSLGLTVGDRLLFVSPFGGPMTPLGPAPRLKPFRVAAIFRSSFFQWDEAFTYTSLAAAQELRRADDVVDGIEVKVEDFYRSQRIGEAVREKLGFPYYARDWKEYFPAFFQALKTERVMMFFLLTMIMVVAAFVIVATLIMMIMEKTSDIAILKTMGAPDASIERIFAIEGTLIGVVGTLVGVVMGIVVTTQLDWIQRQIEAITGIDTLPASVYQLSSLPWEIDPVQVAVVAGIAMVLSLGATLLPSRQGARLDPAEALRYE